MRERSDHTPSLLIPVPQGKYISHNRKSQHPHPQIFLGTLALTPSPTPLLLGFLLQPYWPLCCASNPRGPILGFCTGCALGAFPQPPSCLCLFPNGVCSDHPASNCSWSPAISGPISGFFPAPFFLFPHCLPPSNLIDNQLYGTCC